LTIKSLTDEAEEGYLDFLFEEVPDKLIEVSFNNLYNLTLRIPGMDYNQIELSAFYDYNQYWC
jgi:hypothetical protein